MAFSFLGDYARQDLDNVGILIHPIKTTGVWEKGEIGTVKVSVTNNSGVPLRDVLLTLSVNENAKIMHILFWIDDKWWWKDFEDGETKDAFFILRAEKEGTAIIKASLSAEVVPYATRTNDEEREEIIHPA